MQRVSANLPDLSVDLFGFHNVCMQEPGNGSENPISMSHHNESRDSSTLAEQTNGKHMEPIGNISRRDSTTTQTTVIGPGVVVKGDINGSGSVLIEGTVEGTIHLENDRVTIGKTGRANADISAHEVVVIGVVRGNVTASESVDIRMEGSLTGDVSSKRINLEDGAFFKGNIDIRRQEHAGGVSSFVA